MQSIKEILQTNLDRFSFGKEQPPKDLLEEKPKISSLDYALTDDGKEYMVTALSEFLRQFDMDIPPDVARRQEQADYEKLLKKLPLDTLFTPPQNDMMRFLPIVNSVILVLLTVIILWKM